MKTPQTRSSSRDVPQQQQQQQRSSSRWSTEPSMDNNSSLMDPPGLNDFNIGNKNNVSTRTSTRSQEPIESANTQTYTKRALRKIETVAIIDPFNYNEDTSKYDEIKQSEKYEEMNQVINQLRLELQREILARKELDISIKAILSDMNTFKMDICGQDGSVVENIQREFRETQKSWNLKFNQFEMNLKNQNDSMLRNIDDISGKNEINTMRVEVRNCLKDINDMSHWYYGVVKIQEGVDIVSHDGIRLLYRAKCGETLLLQPPMKKSDDGSIKMSCRIVDEKGQSSTGEVKVAKDDTMFISSFAMAPQIQH